MPYEIETKDGIVLRGIPDDVQPNDPRIKARVEAARAQQRPATPPAQAPAPVAPADEYDPTAGMSTLDKTRANIGAGMANLVHGAKQRVADLFGADRWARELEEETAEKRKRDERLAKAQTGGELLQIGGEIVPMLLVPGGQSVAGAVGAGMAGGYLQPTGKDESAIVNAALGGATGGALSAATKGAGMAYRALRPGTPQTRAAQRIAEELGPDAATRATQVQSIRSALPGATGAAGPRGGLGNLGNTSPGVMPNAAAGPGGIPLSAAARAQNDSLARLEQASRIRNPEMWTDFDREQATALANVVRGATREADDIASRVGTRGENYRTARAGALEAIDPDRFASEVPALREHIDNLLLSPAAVDTDVASALNHVRRTLENERITPEHIAELRKGLSGGLKPGNVLKSADRSNPAILNLTGQLDNLLDNLSGDAWSPVNRGFQRDSVGVEAGRAAQRVRDIFYDPLTGQARKTSATGADVPTVTEAGLQQALKQGFDPKRRANLFSAETRSGLDEALEAVRAQNIIQRMQRTATAGGGSGTASNLSAVAQERARRASLSALERIPGVGGVVRAGAEAAGALRNARTDAALAEALQNPQVMREALDLVQTTTDTRLRARLVAALREAGRNTRNVTPGLTMDIRVDQQPQANQQ